MNEVTLSPLEAIDAIRVARIENQPVCLWGSVGVGKSSIVEQIATAEQISLVEIIGVTLDPVDLRGLPQLSEDGRTRWATPEFLPRDGAGLFFFDEINRAPAMMQNALLQFVLTGRIGEYNCPRDWYRIAACNPDGGGVSKMSEALANRFLHIHIEPSLDDWCKWAIKANLEPVVVAFLRFRPELLNQYERNGLAFPTPRSWSYVSKVVKQKLSAKVELALIAGAVGYAAAIEFISFVQLWRTVPSIDAILLNPATSPVPSDPATLYAVSGALARRATVNNIGRVIQYLERMPQDFNVACIKDATARDAVLTATPEYTKWSVDHSDVMV